VKLHDLRPAPGSRRAKRRVGRGIAAGQGKTAGRGTKGQKARAGGKIPAWFEGGQTPLHQRIPKLRGFRSPFKIEYEVVNVGDIARLVELGELEGGEMPGSKGSSKGSSKGGPAPITVNQEILRAAGLVRRLDRPMKVLGGGGDLGAALFVVADAFSASARARIEAAGGTVSVLEVPDARQPALGVEPESGDSAPPRPARAGRAATDAPTADADAANTEAVEAGAPEAEAPMAISDPGAAEASAAEAPAAAPAAVEPAADEAPASGPAKARTTRAKARTAGGSSVDAAAVEPAEPAAARPRAARKPRAPKPEADA
jgi:large subunit ribosomal protein L15